MMNKMFQHKKARNQKRLAEILCVFGIFCAVFLYLLSNAPGAYSAPVASADREVVSPETAPERKLSRTTVYIAEMDGVVGVPLEEHIESVFREVTGRENVLLIFKMNTPGGLVESMSQIISQIAEAPYPVVVWVAPSGARAASAGAFIVQAAHVAVMAPGTNIGAAHPVTGSGSDIEDTEMNRKVVNDLTAKIRSFAQERGRNVEAVESMVLESSSLTAREALEQNVIDFIAADEDELLEKLEGREVAVRGKPAVISLENHEIRRIEMTFRLRALELFSRPDIAYLALIAGVFLIILELRSPGGFVMGVAGALLLLIASYGLRVLPVNFAGVALLVGGIVVITADLMVGGIGILAAIGIGAMLFGGLILYRAPGGELLRVSGGFVVGVTLVLGLMFLFVLRLIYKALKRKPTSGKEGMIGERVKITGSTEKNLIAFIHGEYWRVLPVEPYLDLEIGDEVEVMNVESLTLYVKPVKKQMNHMNEE